MRLELADKIRNCGIPGENRTAAIDDPDSETPSETRIADFKSTALLLFCSTPMDAPDSVEVPGGVLLFLRFLFPIINISTGYPPPLSPKSTTVLMLWKPCSFSGGMRPAAAAAAPPDRSPYEDPASPVRDDGSQGLARWPGLAVSSEINEYTCFYEIYRCPNIKTSTQFSLSIRRTENPRKRFSITHWDKKPQRLI